MTITAMKTIDSPWVNTEKLTKISRLKYAKYINQQNVYSTFGMIFFHLI